MERRVLQLARSITIDGWRHALSDGHAANTTGGGEDQWEKVNFHMQTIANHGAVWWHTRCRTFSRGTSLWVPNTSMSSPHCAQVSKRSLLGSLTSCLRVHSDGELEGHILCCSHVRTREMAAPKGACCCTAWHGATTSMPRGSSPRHRAPYLGAALTGGETEELMKVMRIRAS